MNQKKAKLLRREAQALAQGQLPQTQYDREEYKRNVIDYELNDHGVMEPKVVEEVRYTQYMTQCVRKIYKELKKEYEVTKGRVPLYGLTAMINQ